jgi:hypothetical protein
MTRYVSQSACLANERPLCSIPISPQKRLHPLWHLSEPPYKVSCCHLSVPTILNFFFLPIAEHSAQWLMSIWPQVQFPFRWQSRGHISFFMLSVLGTLYLFNKFLLNWWKVTDLQQIKRTKTGKGRVEGLTNKWVWERQFRDWCMCVWRKALGEGDLGGQGFT